MHFKVGGNSFQQFEGEYRNAYQNLCPIIAIQFDGMSNHSNNRSYLKHSDFGFKYLYSKTAKWNQLFFVCEVCAQVKGCSKRLDYAK